MRRRIPGRCNEKARCGAQCALSAHPHKMHICNVSDCELCHPQSDAQARQAEAEAQARPRVDGMDVWTLMLALGGLAGMWMGVI